MNGLQLFDNVEHRPHDHSTKVSRVFSLRAVVVCNVVLLACTRWSRLQALPRAPSDRQLPAGKRSSAFHWLDWRTTVRYVPTHVPPSSAKLAIGQQPAQKKAAILNSGFLDFQTTRRNAIASSPASQQRNVRYAHAAGQSEEPSIRGLASQLLEKFWVFP